MAKIFCPENNTKCTFYLANVFTLLLVYVTGKESKFSYLIDRSALWEKLVSVLLNQRGKEMT